MLIVLISSSHAEYWSYRHLKGHRFENVSNLFKHLSDLAYLRSVTYFHEGSIKYYGMFYSFARVCNFQYFSLFFFVFCASAGWQLRNSVKLRGGIWVGVCVGGSVAPP